MQLGGPPAFCDTFDTAAGTGNRSGQLNGTIWGVSRWTGDMNFGSDHQSPWVPSTLMGCNGPQPAQPDGTDVIICNGQLRESSNDNATGAFEAGTVTALTMYPKQPFNFAGRTGTISFDVSNDTQGSHGAWPELWVTNTPQPAPFLHFEDVGGSIPAHAFGVRLAASTVAGQGAQLGPNCPNDSNIRWTVDSAVAVRNYVIDDTQGYGTRSNMKVTVTGCVIASSGPNGGLNHVEVQVSQNQIDVYATDAGTTTPLVHIATVTNANLSFTQGLVWLEDAHYNADKSLRTPLQHDHTFTWDNFAFDGPLVARDLSYDVVDSLTACHDGTVCLGWNSMPAQPASLNTLPITPAAIGAASAQFLMFNAYFQTQPQTFSLILNGHFYTFAWPLPYTSNFETGSFIFPVNKAHLIAGPNAITLWSDQTMVVMNVNIVLAAAGGVPAAPAAAAASSAGGIAPPPTVALAASPTSISAGEISTVTWSSMNATSCTAGGGWTGTKATSGVLGVSPQTTTTYTLTCTGPGGTSAAASTPVSVGAATVASMAAFGSVALSSIQTPRTPTPAPIASCGMQLGSTPAFCDTFDTAAGIGSRSGQLNGTIWGASRWTGDMNFGSDYQVPWVPSTLAGCNGPQPARPDGTDIIICNGQLRESSNDNATGAFGAGTVTALAMYPKQPFNFAGRTGTISFDVSNDTQGTQGAWPELWVTDSSKPTPFLHFSNAGGSIPANGFGIRFAASTIAGQGGQLSSNCPNDNNVRWTVDSMVAVRNYVIDDTQGFGTRSQMKVTRTGCVIASSGADGGLNHVEVRVSQNQVDVYATDAGTTAPLVHIASITNANLTLTQGLIWIEDVHNNADGSSRTPLQHNHTFTWDNFAFDGPVVARDLSYDVLDSLTACHDGTLCLGWESAGASQPAQVKTLPLTSTAIGAAQGQFLAFNAFFSTQPTSFSLTLNGHSYKFAWPFPYSSTSQINSFMFSVNKSDLVAGPNAITLWSDQAMVVMNINVVLAGAAPAVGTMD